MKTSKFLIAYEMPSVAEFVSFDCLHTIIGCYVAWKINRKMKRYQKRQNRKEFLEILKSKF